MEVSPACLLCSSATSRLPSPGTWFGKSLLSTEHPLCGRSGSGASRGHAPTVCPRTGSDTARPEPPVWKFPSVPGVALRSRYPRPISAGPRSNGCEAVDVDATASSRRWQITENRRRKNPSRTRHSSPSRPPGAANRQRSHPASKQLCEPVPNTEQNSPLWWTNIHSSSTPGRWGALPQAPDTEGDYDYTKYDFPLWWGSIRFADLIKIAQANGPKIWTMRLVLAERTWRSSFLRERAVVSARLRRTDWSQVPATDLVAFLEGATAINVGIGALPREYANLSFAARSVLYLRMLILWGVVRGGPFQLRPALEAVRLYEGAPYAVTEMVRRGAKHVGMHMVLLLLSKDEATVKALEGLRRLTYGYFKKPRKRALRRYIERTLDRDLGAGERPNALFRQEVDVQAFRTGRQRWGALGPRGLILQWLAGKLDIAHWAIADDLHDAARAITRRRDREELLNEDEILSIDIDDETMEKVPSARGVREGVHVQAQLAFRHLGEQAELRDFVDKFLDAHPHQRRGIEVLLSEKPRADLAKQHRVTVKTLIDWKNRAVAALQKWIQEQDL